MKLSKSKMPRAKSRLAALIASLLSLGLILAIAALLLFAWIAEEMPEGDTVVFDNAVRGFVHNYSASWLTFAMQGFSFLGSTVFLTLAAVVVLVVLFRAGHKHSAILFSVTMVGATILNFVLKVSFVRERPVPYFDTPLPSSYSFPSGHALFSLCFYGSIAWVISAHLKRMSSKSATWSFTALLIFFIGMSRIYLGVHYPSDVIAGFAAAFVWVSAVFGSDAVLARNRPDR